MSGQAFSATLAHAAVVLVWLSCLAFHGTYFSNAVGWQSAPTLCLPSATLVWAVVGQDILNLGTGAYFQGQYSLAALFPVFRGAGLVSAQDHVFHSL